MMKWTKEEEDYMKEFYYIRSVNEICEDLNKTRDSVMQKAVRMNLKQEKERIIEESFSNYDKKRMLLMWHYNFILPEVSESLNKPKSVIKKVMMAEFGLYFKEKRKKEKPKLNLLKKQNIVGSVEFALDQIQQEKNSQICTMLYYGKDSKEYKHGFEYNGRDLYLQCLFNDYDKAVKLNNKQKQKKILEYQKTEDLFTKINNDFLCLERVLKTDEEDVYELHFGS